MVQKIHSIHVGSYFIIKNIENNKTRFQALFQETKVDNNKTQENKNFYISDPKPCDNKEKNLGQIQVKNSTARLTLRLTKSVINKLKK